MEGFVLTYLVISSLSKPSVDGKSLLRRPYINSYFLVVIN